MKSLEIRIVWSVAVDKGNFQKALHETFFTTYRPGLQIISFSSYPETLIITLDRWIRGGSDQLFASTGCHVFLSEVTVLLPQTWTTIGTTVADSPIELADNISHEDGHIR